MLFFLVQFEFSLCVPVSAGRQIFSKAPFSAVCFDRYRYIVCEECVYSQNVFSLSRMCPLVRLPDCIFRRICRIHLRGCQVGMPHHGLNSAHVSAVAQKMDRKRVAQGVRCDVLLDPGPLPIIFDQLPEALTAHDSSAAVCKEKFRTHSL